MWKQKWLIELLGSYSFLEFNMMIKVEQKKTPKEPFSLKLQVFSKYRASEKNVNWLYQKYHLCCEEVSTTLKQWILVTLLPVSPCCCLVGASISQGTTQTRESCCLQTMRGTASGLSQTSSFGIASPYDPVSTEKTKEEGKGHHRLTQQAVGIAFSSVLSIWALQHQNLDLGSSFCSCSAPNSSHSSSLSSESADQLYYYSFCSPF